MTTIAYLLDNAFHGKDTDMVTKVSAKDARNNFSELMGRVRYGREIVIIEKQKQPMVAMIPADQLDDLLSLRRQRFTALNSIRERLPEVPDDEISQDVEEALKAVRALHD